MPEINSRRPSIECYRQTLREGQLFTLESGDTWRIEEIHVRPWRFPLPWNTAICFYQGGEPIPEWYQEDVFRGKDGSRRVEFCVTSIATALITVKQNL